MAERKFNIQDLQREVFGYVAPPFPFQGLPDADELLPVKKLRGLFNTNSMLGTELVMPTQLRIANRENEEWVQLPNEPIIRVSGSKNIVTTTINRGENRKGTVKEDINLGDYSIRIKGLCINEDEDDYPEEQVNQIRRLVESRGNLEIRNIMTRIFNINQITVKDFDFPRGEENPFRVQPYEIKAVSDEDFELELINEQ